MKGLLKGLFSLGISLIGIVSFCSAEKVDDLITVVSSGTFNFYNTSSSFKSYTLYDIGTNYGTYCIKFTDLVRDTSISSVSHFSLGFSNSSSTRPTNNYFYYIDQVGNTICLYGNKRYFLLGNVASSNNCYVNSAISFSGSYIFYKLNTLLDTDLPQYTYTVSDLGNGTEFTGTIDKDLLVGYGNGLTVYTGDIDIGRIVIDYDRDILIEKSDIDSNYCESNNLCSSSGGGNCSTGDISWSSVYINDIQHLGGPTINMTIPEEISWDYNYSNTNDMYINVEGYNVDYDKINGIVDIQNYKPNSEDFNKLVSEVLPLLIPGLVVILFLYFIFRFIKKIF